MTMVMNLWRRSDRLLALIPEGLDALLARIAIAHVFFTSGQTKVNGFHLKDSVIDLFSEEYNLPLIPPEIAAPMAAIAEHLFPALLVLGLATRLSALALLVMTAVIQIFVYPDAFWTVHILWMAILVHLIRTGGGALSLDALILRKARG